MSYNIEHTPAFVVVDDDRDIVLQVRPSGSESVEVTDDAGNIDVTIEALDLFCREWLKRRNLPTDATHDSPVVLTAGQNLTGVSFRAGTTFVVIEPSDMSHAEAIKWVEKVLMTRVLHGGRTHPGVVFVRRVGE